MAETIYKKGIKKEYLKNLLEQYKKDASREIEKGKNPIDQIRKLEESLDKYKRQEERLIASGDKESLKEVKEAIVEINSNLISINLEYKEYIKAKYVLNEIEDLLNKSENEHSFVDGELITKRKEFYKNKLKECDEDKTTSSSKKEKNVEEVFANEIDAQIDQIRDKIAGKLGVVKDSKEVEDAYIHGISYQFDDWEKDEILENREKLKELIARKKEKENEIEEEIDKLRDEIAGKLGVDKDSKEVEDAYIHGISYQFDDWEKDEILEKRERLKELISSKNKKLEDKSKENEEKSKLDLQDRKIIEARIEELERLEKECTLFKINDNGEIEIKYPMIEPKIDMKAIEEEYKYRKLDMVDKYYGNSKKAKEYSETLKQFQSHIVEKNYEYIDNKGKLVTSKYNTIEDYEGIEEDVKFLQLEEYAERLERLTKLENGDTRIYDENNLGLNEEDINYIQSNNSAYNRLIATRDNLKTLGKYGEKVAYTKLNQGQPIKNIARGLGNTLKFVRNNVTAPINKFLGKKIVSPIYGKVTKADENSKGLYSNKTSHRYAARRDYFTAQGKGYFGSRFNSIFKAKEGNKAILSAGAYDIQESIKQKYIELAQKEAKRKQIEFVGKDISSQIGLIQNQLKDKVVEKDKEKLENLLDDLMKAKVQLDKDNIQNENKKILNTIQTDAVDMKQHDIANKENVTRVITGVKMLSRMGIKKFVGPKIEDWLQDNMLVKQKSIESTSEEITTSEFVPTTYKEEIVPVYDSKIDLDSNLEDIVSANSGKEVEGFYSVYGGEAKPVTYNITGNEKITAIFRAEGDGGIGLSDASGLKAPEFTSGTFTESLIDANGVLNQNISLEDVLEGINDGTINEEMLGDVYVSISDGYWTKLSNLTDVTEKSIEAGEKTVKVIDELGHWEDITEIIEGTQVVEKMVPNERVINALGTIKKGTYTTLLADDIYENVRKTDSNIPKNKPKDGERNYAFEAGFKGIKKVDKTKEIVEATPKEINQENPREVEDEER